MQELFGRLIGLVAVMRTVEGRALSTPRLEKHPTKNLVF